MAAKTGQSSRAKARMRALGLEAPVGRPRTSIEDLPENWKEIMMAEAQDGGGPTAYMVKLGIAHTAFNTLMDDSEDFQNTFEACMLLCRYWWETQGRRMASGADGNATVWSLNMTNRFNWRSGRNEVVGDPNAPVVNKHEVKNVTMTKEEIMKELEARGLPTSLLED